ncbi:photoreceptor cilium actin regulator [Nematolebias whitei]|uniref:photoreceptor cilium actin regulator n=1 Tax=Nematolebias whitei TaxID=451745 RepID=UPI0018997D81|nr:photoreceptor cilium actin regulator [Nematolebias whitei]
MGCSPSKGNNFGTLGTMKKGRMLPFVPQEKHPPHEDEDNYNSTGATNGDIKEQKGALHILTSQEEQMTPQKKRPVPKQVNVEAVAISKLENRVMNNSTASLRKEKIMDKQDLVDKKSCKKTKKNNKSGRTPKKKDVDKNKVFTDQKVDFPEPLVEAHQAAYAFLNPSINKYDSLLGLLEQVTQTQVSVQTMVAFMALRYEEIIEGLGEMAEEGEKLLKEHGEHLAWTSQMKNLSSSPPRKSGSVIDQPPPDLLQQLLQYTTQRMRNVSHTVGGIGDSALEEAVEYFASVSELLEEKLKAKHAAQVRLMQLLTRIEMASLQKPGPEDSALFSEDSGIGAENESLNGSEKCHRRESCGSTGTNRSIVSRRKNTSINLSGASRQKYQTQISQSVSLTSLNSLDSTCTITPNDQKDSVLGSVSLDDGEDDNNDEEEVDREVEDVQVAFRMRSNSSPVSSEKPTHRPPIKRIENPQNVEMTLKMKKAISGKIQFVPKQNTAAHFKVAGSPKTIRREWTDEELQSPKRPQTAAAVQTAEVKKKPVTRGQRSRSAESLRSRGEDPTLLELERTQKNLNQRLQRMSKSKVGENTRTAPLKSVQRNSSNHLPTINRKHSSQGKDSNAQPLKDTNKKVGPTNDMEEDKQKETKTSRGPIKVTPPPSPPLSPRPSSGLHRGRNSVKKLIDTFSQGIEDKEGPQFLGALKGVRRCGVPVLPGLGNVEAVLSAGLTSCRLESTVPGKTDCFDLDSLPPPPLEVLMDNSFESVPSPAAGDGATKVGKSPVLKRAAVSHRLRASVQSVTVLPSKGGLPQSSKVVSTARLDQQATSVSSKVSQSDVQPHPGIGTDSLFQQAKKIINLRQSSDSNPERSSTKCVATSKVQGETTVPETSASTYTVPTVPVATSQPPATPPITRGRILPSTPPISNSLHRRLPSPHSLKSPSMPPSTVTSPVRTLPAPPDLQKRLPSPPVLKKDILNSNSAQSYSFKAPSPPASPKVKRWSRENSNEDSSGARTFSNARSVFCPSSPSMFEAQPCSAPQPPQAWTSTRVSVLSRFWGSRGRFSESVQRTRSLVRRSHSDRRPSLSMAQQPQGFSVAEICGSEPAISSKGLDDEPTGYEDLWGSQSELRATTRSASHPDLCVVGRALHRV